VQFYCWGSAIASTAPSVAHLIAIVFVVIVVIPAIVIVIALIFVLILLLLLFLRRWILRRWFATFLTALNLNLLPSFLIL
jgi:hypothetical protein